MVHIPFVLIVPDTLYLLKSVELFARDGDLVQNGNGEHARNIGRLRLNSADLVNARIAWRKSPPERQAQSLSSI
jgi:hypothetical protein